jgi:hypothetical protein
VIAEGADFGFSVGGGDSARDKGVNIRVWRTDATDDRWTLLAELSAPVP